MRLLIFASVLLAAAGCSSRGSHDATTVTVQSSPNYPFSEVEAVYDAVLDGLTSTYFAAFPELDKKHTKAMREYIADAYSKDRFVKEMIPENYRPVFNRAMHEPAFRETKEFKDALLIVVNVSMPMAKMIVGGRRDIYVAKFVDRNPVRVELLSIAKTEDEQQCASWAGSEVTREEAAKDCGNEYKPAEGDRVYTFSSPAEMWENLCGRQGYIVVRDGKIAKMIVTVLN